MCLVNEGAKCHTCNSQDSLKLSFSLSLTLSLSLALFLYISVSLSIYPSIYSFLSFSFSLSPLSVCHWFAAISVNAPTPLLTIVTHRQTSGQTSISVNFPSEFLILKYLMKLTMTTIFLKIWRHVLLKAKFIQKITYYQ